jgi:hypothetical protein
MAAIVFVGPTLAPHEAVKYLDCISLPPARQGDIYRAVRDRRPAAIGLIDGMFLDVPSVWHREILWALTEGVHVFGAGSMGALRAVELAPFGMRGIGRVYDAYMCGRWPGFDEPFEDDDEVAVIHAPPETGGAPLSDAMVDLRETLLAAEAAAVIDEASRCKLAAAAKQLHFPDRSFDQLAKFALEMLDEASAAVFTEWLTTNRIFRKRLDAIELLQNMSAFIRSNPGPFVPQFQFESALVWQAFITEGDRSDVAEQRVLEELRLEPHAWRRAAQAALCRREALWTVSTTREERSPRHELDQFRRQRGLWMRMDMDAWLMENGLSSAEFERLIHEEALLMEAASDQIARLTSVMVDHLRLSGDYASLLRRAQAKRAMLDSRVDVKQSPTELDMQIALEWYFERHSLPQPGAIAEYAIDAGWSGDVEFRQAVWEDYVFEKYEQ